MELKQFNSFPLNKKKISGFSDLADYVKVQLEYISGEHIVCKLLL